MPRKVSAKYGPAGHSHDAMPSAENGEARQAVGPTAVKAAAVEPGQVQEVGEAVRVTNGHDHGHDDDTRHGPHKQTRAVLNRLSRTEGHLRGVRRMVEAGSPCSDVLIQLAAVRAAVDKIARVVLEDHVESCLRQAASNGKTDDEWSSLKEALDRFIS